MLLFENLLDVLGKETILLLDRSELALVCYDGIHGIFALLLDRF
jgi:hypothetical protein